MKVKRKAPVQADAGAAPTAGATTTRQDNEDAPTSGLTPEQKDNSLLDVCWNRSVHQPGVRIVGFVDGGVWKCKPASEAKEDMSVMVRIVCLYQDGVRVG